MPSPTSRRPAGVRRRSLPPPHRFMSRRRRPMPRKIQAPSVPSSRRWRTIGARRDPGSGIDRGVLMADRVFSLMGVVASLMLATAVVSAQDTRPAEQVYKNIKVMKGLPANQIIQGMHLIKAALGVDCTHCQVEMEWDREIGRASCRERVERWVGDESCKETGRG